MEELAFGWGRRRDELKWRGKKGAGRWAYEVYVTVSEHGLSVEMA